MTAPIQRAPDRGRALDAGPRRLCEIPRVLAVRRRAAPDREDASERREAVAWSTMGNGAKAVLVCAVQAENSFLAALS